MSRQDQARASSPIVSNQMLLEAADTLQALRDHQFSVSGLINTHVRNFIGRISSEFVIETSPGLLRLHFKEPTTRENQSDVVRKATEIHQTAEQRAQQIVERQLSLLSKVCDFVKVHAKWPSQQVITGVDELKHFITRNLAEPGSLQPPMRRGREVEAVIGYLRELANRTQTPSSLPQGEKPNVPSIKAEDIFHSLSSPKTPTWRPQQVGAGQDCKTVQSRNTSNTLSSSVPGQGLCEHNPQLRGFFAEWMCENYDVPHEQADLIAAGLSEEALNNLESAFGQFDTTLKRTLGRTYPEIFDPWRGQNWPTYSSLLTQAIDLAGGASAVLEHIHILETCDTLKNFIKEFKRNSFHREAS